MEEKSARKFINARKCEGYANPEDNMITVTYDDRGTSELYLTVNERVNWFNMYCLENDYVGCIDDSDITFSDELKMAVVKATVSINGVVVGKSVAGCPLTGDYANDRRGVQNAGTAAKGRALANAGFNLSGAGSSNPDEDGDGFPADTGIRITVRDGQVHRAYNNPMHMTGISGNSPDDADDSDLPFTFGPDPAPAPVPPQAPAQQAPQQPTHRGRKKEDTAAGSQPMSREEALKYVIASGQHKGKTLGELMGENPGMVEFYAKSYTGRDANLKRAAQVVWDNAK